MQNTLSALIKGETGRAFLIENKLIYWASSLTADGVKPPADERDGAGDTTERASPLTSPLTSPTISDG
ncbi:MAG: hypothetical protein WAO26_10910 [Porticoccaceae bacterium]